MKMTVDFDTISELEEFVKHFGNKGTKVEAPKASKPLQPVQTVSQPLQQPQIAQPVQAIQPVPQPVQQPMQPMPQVIAPTIQPVQQPQPMPIQQQPQPVQQPMPTAVPTATATYTMEQLALAATQLMDNGRRQDLVNLLGAFQVQALTMLPKAQYGAFATKLREMGARI